MRLESRLSISTLFAFAILIVLAGPGASAADACEKANAAYFESFASQNDAWQARSPQAKLTMGNGVMAVEIPGNSASDIVYNGDNYSGGSFCTTVTQTTAGDSGSSAGIVVWYLAQRDTFLYAFEIEPVTGNFAIIRYKAGSWLYPVDWKPSAAIHKGVGQSNELRVDVAGERASAYINGTLVARISGYPPAKQWLAGVRAEGGTTLPTSWAFHSFSVSAPAP